MFSGAETVGAMSVVGMKVGEGCGVTGTELVGTIRISVLTRVPQNIQGPEPSCSHTTLPQLRQLFISPCLCAWHVQARRPTNHPLKICGTGHGNTIGLIQKMAQSLLNGTTQPVDSEEEG